MAIFLFDLEPLIYFYWPPKVCGLAVNENLQLNKKLGEEWENGIKWVFVKNVISRCGKIRLNLINKVKIVVKKSFKRILFNMNIHLSNMTIIKKLNVTNAIKK